jgi:predicted DNA-binding transcriptional regulator YafY
MGDWTFITKHGLVLSYISRQPRSTTREIALALGFTERTAHKIIADLEAAGYLKRRKIGRSNTYRINPDLPLRHETMRDAVIGDLLEILGWKRHRTPKRARQVYSL